ncbi:hypothetical protein HYQ45_009469 [Verticillium longisporum]|uniref:BTB domain-containing protein n=1 Tax=Verticillium longisporum TaxID=100787 RepID=A0A8I2ZL53_VERLO|nr:hypothetical protein HYQ44_004029 [Verticillium longisporum]KAG7132096.1 hypothetical protein HYQ45_009469 [Verticillium longisporum]
MESGIELGIERVGDGRYSLRLIPTKNGQDVYLEPARRSEEEVRLDEVKADHLIAKLLSEGNSNEATAGKVLQQRRVQLTNNLSPLEKVSEAREWLSQESKTTKRSPVQITPSKNGSQAPISPFSEYVAIQVGERLFQTTRTTLRKSPLLRNLISQHVASRTNPLFLDTDPATFADLLAYFRTALYPLFWSASAGHNLPRYASLHAAARYFRVRDLESWLARKAYLSVVTVDVRLRKAEVLGRQPFHRQHILRGHQTLTVGAAVAGREIVWTCPAGNGEHDGDSLMCEVEGCCGSMMTNSAKDRPEQRVLMDVVKIITEERTYSVDEKMLWSWEDEGERGQ